MNSAPLHAHKRGDASHTHAVADRKQSFLWIAMLFTLGFACVEFFAGLISGSLALMSDAGHMVTDSAALGLAILAQYIARRPPSAKHSFGFGRAEALAAFVNSLVMVGLVIWIVIEAVSRIQDPHPVAGMTVTIVAALGLAVNLIVAWVLSRDQKSVNTRAALVHVMGDLLGSIAALVAGVVIQLTGWMPIDPILSIFVALLILKSTAAILKESYHFLMEGVPLHIDYVKVGEDLSRIEGVMAIHDLHVWEMSPGHPALIAHVEIKQFKQWPRILANLTTMLRESYGIDHITLQPEEAGKQELESPPVSVEQARHTALLNRDHHGHTDYVQCTSPAGSHRMAFHTWGDPQNPSVLYCVHGLSRRGSDFRAMAEALCDRHFVVCPDIVGRGDSDYLSNPMFYTVPQYVTDMTALSAKLKVQTANWFGTSMGGLIGMVYAAIPGNGVKRLLLNDVGPRIEPAALIRLASYVGKPFSYVNRVVAMDKLKSICAPFGKHTDAEWELLNGPMLIQKDQQWVLHYDPAISVPFASVTPALAQAGELAMWQSFQQIECPILIVRGADSDLLSPQTVDEMCQLNPHAKSIEIPNTGHAPAFIKKEQIDIARQFFL
ncbi:alpha/beta fold hydrolase [Polynucleobacter sp. HIN7]|uniref:alpha/beta fold hydrolase n=1 Tax=Polynucleobacter sp. HIN7 TaxID=3047866 RepID=UPI0025728486|nr:alpha/beta fold hydrolase [Polynucleobacter sp. HIN7]